MSRIHPLILEGGLVISLGICQARSLEHIGHLVSISGTPLVAMIAPETE